MEEEKCTQSNKFKSQNTKLTNKLDFELEQCDTDFVDNKNIIYNLPKRPLSAYLLYLKDTRSDILKEQPDI